MTARTFCLGNQSRVVRFPAPRDWQDRWWSVLDGRSWRTIEAGREASAQHAREHAATIIVALLRAGWHEQPPTNVAKTGQKPTLQPVHRPAENAENRRKIDLSENFL